MNTTTVTDKKVPSLFGVPFNDPNFGKVLEKMADRDVIFNAKHIYENSHEDFFVSLKDKKPLFLYTAALEFLNEKNYTKFNEIMSNHFNLVTSFKDTTFLKRERVLKSLAKKINKDNLNLFSEQKWFTWKNNNLWGLGEEALTVGNLFLFDHFVKVKGLNSRHAEKSSYLHLAVYNNKADLVDKVLEYKPDVNYKNDVDGGETPLMTCIKRSNSSRKANLVHKKFRISPVSLESYSDENLPKWINSDVSLEIMNKLLDAGADASIKNDRNKDAFYYAVNSLNYAAMFLLIKKAKVNLDSSGELGFGKNALDVLDQKMLIMKKFSGVANNPSANFLQLIKAKIESVYINQDLNEGHKKERRGAKLL